MFKEMRKDARKRVVEVLEAGYEGYLSDLHNEVFNMEYYVCYYNEAVAILGSRVYDAVGYIVDYEKENFGEVNTNFFDPCAVVNMLWYIIGEEELCSMFEGCEEWDEFWNEEIGETETKVLIAWLKDNEEV